MSFQQGLSGLFAAAQNLDVIGNNVANASTVGFKGAGAIFADVYANSLAAGGGPGIGVSVAAIQQNFVQGNVKTTSNPLDVAINGQGFFRLDTNGTVTYSRNGQFHLDKDGFVVNATGSKVTGYGIDASGNIVVSNATPLQVSMTPLKAQATATADIGLNLDAREPIIAAAFDPTDAKTYNKATSMTVYDSHGNPHAFTTYYVKTAANTWAVYGVDGWNRVARAGRHAQFQDRRHAEQWHAGTSVQHLRNASRRARSRRSRSPSTTPVRRSSAANSPYRR